MKFLEKVKNMFTEEVEEEVKPIKTEIRKVEIPMPTKPLVTESKSVVEDKSSEVDNTKKEEKFKFPVYFDDKDFDKLPKTGEKKEEPKRVEVKQLPKTPPKELPRKEAYGGKNPAFSASVAKEEKKTFKPTPIISPVYGVLDKNYKKDDITPKKRVSEPRTSKELTIDDIRNKAFGTLEDELETTLFGKNSPLENKTKEQEEEPLDLFDELDIKVEEPRHGKISETVTPSRTIKNKELDLLNEVENLEQVVVNERPQQSVVPKEISIEEEDIEVKENEENIEKSELETNMIEDEMDKICSEPEEDEFELTESDLFNLIDSMYEKKDGEE